MNECRVQHRWKVHKHFLLTDDTCQATPFRNLLSKWMLSNKKVVIIALINKLLFRSYVCIQLLYKFIVQIMKLLRWVFVSFQIQILNWTHQVQIHDHANGNYNYINGIVLLICLFVICLMFYLPQFLHSTCRNVGKRLLLPFEKYKCNDIVWLTHVLFICPTGYYAPKTMMMTRQG